MIARAETVAVFWHREKRGWWDVSDEMGDEPVGIKGIIPEGRVRCARCRGHGRVERLDSGVMRRFGLREWDGCSECGGRLARSGLGHVAVDPGDRARERSEIRKADESLDEMPEWCEAASNGGDA